MTTKDKIDRIRLRAKSFNITADETITAIIVNAAAYLTINANVVDTVAGQPSIAAMRAPLLPAYTAIATGFSDVLRVTPSIRPEQLTGLCVDLRPVLGTWVLQFNYRRPDGKIQPYIFHVSAQCGGNTFLRVRQVKGADEAQKFIDAI